MQHRIPTREYSWPARPLRRMAPAFAPILLLAVLGCGEEATSPAAPDTPPKPTLEVTATATYTMKDLGTLGGHSSQALAINKGGAIVGASDLASGASHAFLYKAGVMRDLGALAGGRSWARAINDSGVVIGASWVLSGATRAVRWKNGFKKNLGTLGGRNSEATGINLSGVIVGWSETSAGRRHSFVWKDGVMTDMGTLGGPTSAANGINRAGMVVGSSTTASGELHAFAWKAGVFSDLGTHGRESSAATAVNNAGQIVGSLGPYLDAVGEERDWETPFLFYRYAWTVFATFQPTSTARAISAWGIVVGSDDDLRGETSTTDAWVWESGFGTAQRLPKLAAGASIAYGINQYGAIVGYSATPSGNGHAVLWRRQ
jgi:probable HAF family extracellular repeat protein